MSAPRSVIVVGSINIDLVAVGERMPAPGETVLMTSYAEHFGGKGGNQAAAAAALGATVVMVGAVGNDAHGDAALADLTSRGIDVTNVARTTGSTGVAVILVSSDGENSIAVVPGANSLLDPHAVWQALDAIPDGDHIVVTSLEIPLDAVKAAAGHAIDRGWTFILNPAPAQLLPAELVAATSVMTPNAHEVELLGGVAALLAGGTDAVVVTRGGEGADFHVAYASEHVPPAKASVVDTTGAGDTFTAALAVALVRGKSLPQAVAWASAAGAIATEAAGARGSLPSTEQTNARLAGDGAE